MSNIKPVGYRNKFTGMIWTLEQQPGAENEPDIYESLVLQSDVLGLVAENSELKSRTVTVPAKVYVKDMRCNVIRWAQVIDALSDAGVAFVRDDGEPIAGARETPATDAFTAELRAQGVDALAARRKAAAYVAMGNNDKANFEELSGEAARAAMFAEELRAGRKG